MSTFALRFSKHLRAIQAIVPLAFLSCQVLVLVLKGYYGRFSPLVADKASSHVYPIQLHGAVIYVTPVQHYTIAMIYVSSGIILVLGLLLINRIKSNQKST